MTSSPDPTPVAASVTDIGLQRIDHVGIAVPDLDVAIEFYASVFGIQCEHIEENQEQGVREAMLAPDPNAKGGRIQLLAPINENSAVGKFLANKGPGVHHVAYTVTDVEAAADALRAKGLRLLNEAPRRGTHGSRINFVHPKDARGVLVELVEPSAEH